LFLLDPKKNNQSLILHLLFEGMAKVTNSAFYFQFFFSFSYFFAVLKNLPESEVFVDQDCKNLDRQKQQKNFPPSEE
jgi:hypothetical protein